MYVCMYVCMYIYIYVCMCTCYSAPSRFLLRGAPEDSADTGSEFHAEAHEQLRVKDLLKVPRHNDRWDGARTRNLRVTGQALQPVGHRASLIYIYMTVCLYINQSGSSSSIYFIKPLANALRVHQIQLEHEINIKISNFKTKRHRSHEEIKR